MSINISVCILKYCSILSLVLYVLFSVGSRSNLTKQCVATRTLSVASSFLIHHLSINYFSFIGYFFSPENTPHIPNFPSKSLERYHGSSLGDMDVIIELTTTLYVPIAGFYTVGSSGVSMLLLMLPSWYNIQFSLIP